MNSYINQCYKYCLKGFALRLNKTLGLRFPSIHFNLVFKQHVLDTVSISNQFKLAIFVKELQTVTISINQISNETVTQIKSIQAQF